MNQHFGIDTITDRTGLHSVLLPLQMSWPEDKVTLPMYEYAKGHFNNGGFQLTHVGVRGKRLLEITKVDWNHLLKGGCMVRVQKIYFAKKISIWLNRLDQVISIK